MAKWGKVDYRALKRMQEKLERLEKMEYDKLCDKLAKELAARLLAKVVKRTPVGDYKKDNDVKTYKRSNAKKGIVAGDIRYDKNGKPLREKFKTVSFTTKAGKKVSFKATEHRVGGMLRRGWTASTEEEAKNKGEVGIQAYVKALPIKKSSNMTQIEIDNPVHYAIYVEYGHRTRDHKGWVSGQFMLTKAELELEKQMPGIIEKKLQAKLKEVFNGDK